MVGEIERLRSAAVRLLLTVLAARSVRRRICCCRWTPLSEAQAIDPGLADPVLIELRLPRTLLVLGYGAALGMSGAALQAMFANPLASPDISGASSGAALGAVFGGYWLGFTQPLALAACGAAGALGTLALLVALAGRRADTATLLLAGLAISLAAGAATSLALALAPSPFAFYDAFDWLMGSFTDRSLAQAAAALFPPALRLRCSCAASRALDLIALGDDVAASLGLRPRRLAIEVIALSAIAVGACVSVGGAIGFVGLVAPVFGRQVWPRASGPGAGPGGDDRRDAADRRRPAWSRRSRSTGRSRSASSPPCSERPLFLWLVLTMRRRVTA